MRERRHKFFILKHKRETVAMNLQDKGILLILCQYDNLDEMNEIFKDTDDLSSLTKRWIT